MPDVSQPRADEPLKRMSFGDHLEELRRRLFKALGAIALGVVVLMPFKHEVTEIYLKPYRSCWMMGYERHLAKWDAKIGLVGDYRTLSEQEKKDVQARIAALPDEDERRMHTWNLDNRHLVFAGGMEEFKVRGLENHSGYSLPYTLKALAGLDDMFTFMAATMLFGVMLASPVVIWQIWGFIGAGLYPHERRTVWIYLPFAMGLFGLGIAFGYFLAVPFGLFMLTQYMSNDQVNPLFGVSNYFSFFFSFCAALGVVFEMPLVMLMLTKIGIVTHAAMRKNWRYVILGIFLVAMIFTPPDPFSMLLMAAPMTLLYGLGLILTAGVAKKAVGAQLTAGQPA